VTDGVSNRPVFWQVRVQEILWAVLLVVVCLAAVISLPSLPAMYRALAPQAQPGIIGGIGIAVAYAFVLIAVLGTLAFVAGRFKRVGTVAALLLLILVRLAGSAGIDAPLISDWEHYHQLALGTLRDAPLIADLPMGFPIVLGFAYRLGGVSISSGEGVNILASVATGILLACWVWRWAGPVAAAVAVGLLALTPSQVLHTVLLGSESWFCTAVVAGALGASELFRAASAHRPSSILWAACTGAAFGVAYWMRATGLPILVAFTVLPVILLPLRQAAAHGVVIAISGGLVLAPIAAANLTLLERPSVSNSLYLGWQLYVGTNVDSGGTYSNLDELRLEAALDIPSVNVPAEFAKGNVRPAVLRAAAKRDEVAMDLAMERLGSIQVAQLPRLLANKLLVAWGRADNAAAWAFDRGPVPPGMPSAVAHIASQIAWTISLFLAAGWLIIERRRRPVAGLVVAAITLPVFASTMILEAQSRYHEPVVPLITALAGAGIASVVGGPRSLLRSFVRDRSAHRVPVEQP
jgi:hypothetical protein